MKICLVNYGSGRFWFWQKVQNLSARVFGIRNIHSWDRKRLKQTEFYEQNKGILDMERGGGYWLWKPFIILDSLHRMEDGDVVMYMDSGMTLVRKPTPLIKICLENGGFFCLKGAYIQGAWTKRDCFVYMNCDQKKYWEAEQCGGGLLVLQKSKTTVAFVQEWLRYCCEKELITNMPNSCGLPNLEIFREHRHDQSILTNLLVKYQIPCFKAPWMESRNHPLPSLSEYEKKLSQTYGVIAVLHRGKPGKMIRIRLICYLKCLRRRVNC